MTKARAAWLKIQLDGNERHPSQDTVEERLVVMDNALGRLEIHEAGSVLDQFGFPSNGESAAGNLPATDSEVELMVSTGRVARDAEPQSTQGQLAEHLEDAVG